MLLNSKGVENIIVGNDIYHNIIFQVVFKLDFSPLSSTSEFL